MSVIEELKQRKVFRVAALYVLVAWGILQVIDVVGEPLNLPGWFATVVILLLGLGFPIALVFSWIFDVGPKGVSRTDEVVADRGTPRSGLETVLLCVLILGIGWLIVRDITGSGEMNGSPNAVPVVVLMDTFASRGVYDEETRRKSGTNADVLSDILDDLPIMILKEGVGSTWEREAQLVKQNPDLVLIHRSAFFHSMNHDLGIGYSPREGTAEEEFKRLYQIADNKLVAFLGFVAQQNPETHFIVYSRGTGGGWPEQDYRDEWISHAQGRFPDLAERITAVPVPGGTSAGSFRRPDAIALMRSLVIGQLGLEEEVQ